MGNGDGGIEARLYRYERVLRVRSTVGTRCACPLNEAKPLFLTVPCSLRILSSPPSRITRLNHPANTKPQHAEEKWLCYIERTRATRPYRGCATSGCGTLCERSTVGTRCACPLNEAKPLFLTAPCSLRILSSPPSRITRLNHPANTKPQHAEEKWLRYIERTRATRPYRGCATSVFEHASCSGYPNFVIDVM